MGRTVGSKQSAEQVHALTNSLLRFANYLSDYRNAQYDEMTLSQRIAMESMYNTLLEMVHHLELKSDAIKPNLLQDVQNILAETAIIGKTLAFDPPVDAISRTQKLITEIQSLYTLELRFSGNNIEYHQDLPGDSILSPHKEVSPSLQIRLSEQKKGAPRPKIPPSRQKKGAPGPQIRPSRQTSSRFANYEFYAINEQKGDRNTVGSNEALREDNWYELEVWIAVVFRINPA